MKWCHPAVIGSILSLLFFIPLSAAQTFPDYSITFSCGDNCQEGQPTNFSLQVFYDVLAANDRQYQLYAKDHPLHQTYISRITITRIRLWDGLLNTTFFDTPTSLVFADRRMTRNQLLDAQPKIVDSSLVLPKPTQIATLSFVPCFTIVYERELRAYNFFEGDYEPTYPTDEMEQCGNEIISLSVQPKPTPMCHDADCSWYAVCVPDGCRISVGKIVLIIVLALLVLIGGIWFIMHEPRRRFR